MGVCLSHEAEEARRRSSLIDRQLASEAATHSNVVKILMLGAGESGKSTLVKQMKIIHSDGFSKQELHSFKPLILDNLLQSMKYVLSGMGVLHILLNNPKNKLHVQTLLMSQSCLSAEGRVPLQLASALSALWHDSGVRQAVARGYEYELNDSATYFFEHISRLCHERYEPSPMDVLRCRVRTTTILETCFSYKGMVFRLLDVGGQRSERRKWIRCFEDVQALLFVVALSGYDMHLHEDPNVNRLDESLRLFTSIINNEFFRNTSVILFLNKLDLFQDKVRRSGRHLRNYFPNYRGPVGQVEPAAAFIRQLFLNCNRQQRRLLSTHYTTATDTRNVQLVFQVVMESAIRENLSKANLL